MYIYSFNQIIIYLKYEKIKISAFLDNKSEIIIISKWILEILDLSIDININWKINNYQDFEKIESLEMKYSKSIDIYHDILINIKKIKIYLSIFIIKHCDQDLFLNKSWKKYIYIEYKNEDNEDYICIIRNLNKYYQATFIVAKNDHESNR